MNRKAPFGVVGISTLVIVATVATAAAGDQSKKRLTILPPAAAPAERLQAHPRVPVEVTPLSGTMPSVPAMTDSSSDPAGPLGARACATSKLSPSECARLAARMDRFLNERRAEAPVHAPTASDVCGKAGDTASRCAAFVAQIATWVKTRQTAEAGTPPALAGSTMHDR